MICVRMKEEATLDQIMVIKRMRLRHLAAALFASLAVVAIGAVGLVVLLDAGSRGMTIAGGVIVLTILGAAIVFDRILMRREDDRKSLPSRPEFYDFALLNQPMHLAELEGRNLKSLSYVVFDTETTGLRPSGGDEIVSIAGVRVENAEVMPGAAFSRLVNPGFPIPKRSVRIHGITDEMVADEDQITEVLQGFHEFVGDSVLIAHNAAFDMKFLKLKEGLTELKFDHLVLDTLLLSVFLDHDTHNHSLDAIAERLGITVEGRHTALGDSLVTAGIFVRMLEMLETRGITTLRQAIDASNGVAGVRKMQEQF